MGRNTKIMKRIAGRERAIAVHEEKIEAEQSKPKANYSSINHRRSEVEVWKRQIARLTRRLRKG